MEYFYLSNVGEVVKYSSFNEIDEGRFRAALNTFFKPHSKRLVDDYYERTNPLAIYLSDDYSVGAVTLDLEGTVYICKFGVHPDLQRNGTGKDFLRLILMDNGIKPQSDKNSSMCRADPNNTKANGLFASIYVNEDGGRHHPKKSSYGKHQWNIYQVGLKEEELEKKVQSVADLPLTMVPMK